MLPPPPALHSTHPFPSHTSFPLDPPGLNQVDIVREALHAKIHQWRSDQLAVAATSAATTSSTSPSTKTAFSFDPASIHRVVHQHEDVSARHLTQAYQRWMNLSEESKRSNWQLEIMRAFAREAEKRQHLESQLARAQQEANQLRSQVDRLGSYQWPREFAIFPPDMLPLPRDAVRELDSMDSPISPDNVRWDFDTILAKWKRVVMHDKSMGRIGVGHTNPSYEGNTDHHGTGHDPEGSNSTTPHPRISTLQYPLTSGISPDSSSTATVLPPPTASAHHQPRPLHRPPPQPHQPMSPAYQPPDLPRNAPYGSSNSVSGPQAKRPRLVNGGGSTHELSYDNSNNLSKIGPSGPTPAPTLPSPMSTGWTPGSLQSLLSGPTAGDRMSSMSNAMSPAISRPGL